MAQNTLPDTTDKYIISVITWEAGEIERCLSSGQQHCKVWAHACSPPLASTGWSSTSPNNTLPRRGMPSGDFCEYSNRCASIWDTQAGRVCRFAIETMVLPRDIPCFQLYAICDTISICLNLCFPRGVGDFAKRMARQCMIWRIVKIRKECGG